MIMTVRAYGCTAKDAQTKLDAKFVGMGAIEVYFIGGPSVIEQPEATKEERYLASQLVNM